MQNIDYSASMPPSWESPKQFFYIKQFDQGTRFNYLLLDFRRASYVRELHEQAYSKNYTEIKHMKKKGHSSHSDMTKRSQMHITINALTLLLGLRSGDIEFKDFPFVVKLLDNDEPANGSKFLRTKCFSEGVGFKLPPNFHTPFLRVYFSHCRIYNPC